MIIEGIFAREERTPYLLGSFDIEIEGPVYKLYNSRFLRQLFKFKKIGKGLFAAFRIYSVCQGRKAVAASVRASS